MQTLRVRLEERIQNRHMLSHSFYLRWQAGELTKEELRGYAKEYYAFERAFPQFLSTLHSKCDDIKMRQVLLENLIDEERGEENHPELWLRFAEGLGLSREEVKNHFHSDETEHLVRVFKKHTESVVPGLAALYAYERQQPDVVRQKVDGLRAYYDLTDEEAVKFFRVHETADVYHAEAEISLMDRLSQGESDDKAIQAADEVLNALYDFLDGVERRYRPAA